MRFEQLVKEATSALGDEGRAVEAAPPALPWERRVALRNRDRIDPGSIDEYIARCAGYSGLARALELGPEAVIAQLEKTGLRGRGGAGYPAAQKWRICRDAQGDGKYVLCDAVDADPRARTARILLGTDPHGVLEGLLIAAYVVGAGRCHVCINAEYGDEMSLMEAALGQMRERGLLGHDILGSGFSCEIMVEGVPGSLVAGEETALIRLLEGKQALPYLRFDYPAVKGLRGQPTLVNSVETLATVAAIMSQGSAANEAAAANGDRSGAHVAGDAGGASGAAGALGYAGTKIVTICGDVPDEMTVEVPLGMTIGALLEAAVGVSREESGVKAVQFGGPTGAFFAAGPPASGGVGGSLDTPLTYEALEAAGAVMGSATLRVVGEGRDGSTKVCAVKMAHEALSYLQQQSCGKCTACREGTLQLAEMLEDVVEFRAKPEDLELMLELCEAMTMGSICGLGKTAPAPLLSCLRLFADDFHAHVDDKRCPAKE